MNFSKTFKFGFLKNLLNLNFELEYLQDILIKILTFSYIKTI